MDSFNIMGIDPGSRTLGVSIFTIRPKGESTIRDFTLDIENIITFNVRVDDEDTRGLHDKILDRTTKLSKIIKGIYYVYRPMMVSIESSFINANRMGAVIPLTKAIHTVEESIFSIDSYAKIVSIPPGLIKKIFNSKQIGKDAVLEALQDKPELLKKIKSNKEMSEHEIDSIAIAYSLLEYIKTNGGMSCIKYLEAC